MLAGNNQAFGSSSAASFSSMYDNFLSSVCYISKNNSQIASNNEIHWNILKTFFLCSIVINSLKQKEMESRNWIFICDCGKW
jgi:hypothetical protein